MSKEISSPGLAKQIAKRVKEDIDQFCKTAWDDGHRWHLGASLIGKECKRELWYIFRWCKKPDFSGRLQRLFNRGHKEEDRVIEWLEGIGCKVWADDLDNNTLWFHPESDSYFLQPYSVDHPENDVEGLCTPILKDDKYLKHHIGRAKLQGVKFPQYRISGVNGHYGGSLDLIVQFPERYEIEEVVLGEIKTAGEKPFLRMLSKGMVLEKPEHYAQTSVYGKNYSFKYVLYIVVNKNNDEIHVELVELDHNLGEQMSYKAEQIITSQTPPPKLSVSPTLQKCKYCDFKIICHQGAAAEVNCRSCQNATPVDGGEWFCAVHNNVIPRDFVAKGCVENYKSVTENV